MRAGFLDPPELKPKPRKTLNSLSLQPGLNIEVSWQGISEL